MYKFMQRNRRKMLAVFAVGLMIVFVLPQVAFDRTRGTEREVIGSVAGTDIHAGEIRNAHEQWRELMQHDFPGQNDVTGHVALLAEDIERNPALFVLLQKEAEQLGLHVSNESVDDFLTYLQRRNGTFGMRMPDPVALKPALRSVMLVRALMSRVAGSLKPSGPLVLRELADQNQRVKLRLVHYSAEDFKQGVPRPSDDELRKHFDQFKNADPGVATPANPFGFGYRVPAKVRLQYLTVPHDEVARVVRESRSKFDWRVAAIRYHRENPSRYAATQPAETQPTTQPATTRAAANSGPTTRPFAEVEEQVIQDIMKKPIDDKLKEISSGLHARLVADFEAYQKKSASAPGDFGTRQYLERIAADVEKRYGVKLGISEINDPKTQEALAEIKGIGQSFVDERSFAQYVIRWAEPLLPPGQTGPTEVLSLDEPSPRFGDVAGNVYIFQLKDAQAAHAPADISAVKDKVESDLKTKLGFETAAATARKLLDAAGTAPTSGPTSGPATAPSAVASRLEPAAKSAGKDVFVTPDFFDRIGETADRKPAVLIPQVELPEAARDQLVGDAFKQLMLATPDNPHPLSLIELPTAARVVVHELADVERAWTQEQQPLAEMQAARQMTGRNAMRVLRKYFTYDAVKARVDYVPKRPETPGAAG
jgi:hypothetical protein